MNRHVIGSVLWSRRMVLATALVAVVGLGAGAQAGTIAYQVPPGTVGNQDFGGPLGMDFDVNHTMVVTQLGVFDDQSNGLSRDLSVGLWDRTSTGAPLATLSFPAADPGTLAAGSRFKPLAAPRTLLPGFQGTIVAEGYGTGERNGNLGTLPVWGRTGAGGVVSFVGASRWGTTGGTYPPNVDGGPANRYATGTFSFEPANIAYEVFTGAVGGQTFGGSLGMDFDTNKPMQITHLGVFDSGQDGLSIPISARLYDRTSTSTPLASLNFTASEGQLIGGSRFKPLATPLSLPAGFQGTIVADGYGAGEPNGNSGAGPWQTYRGQGALSFVGTSRWGTAGAFPANADGGPANRYAAGSFIFDPAQLPIAYDVFAGTVGNQDFDGSLGMDFVANKPMKITHLGVFDSRQDGLSRTITARLYARSLGGDAMNSADDSGVELVSLTFSGTDGELIGGSRFIELPTPLVLPSGFVGTIVAENYGPGEPNGNTPGGPAMQWATYDGDGLLSFSGGSRWGTAGAFPANADTGPANRFAAGSFQFAPADLVRPGSIQRIDVPNHSFEEPVLADDAWSTSVPGWNATGGTNAGNFNPPTAAFATVPDGQQIGWVASNSFVSDPVGKLEKDTLYIMEMEWGNRGDDGATPNHSINLVAGNQPLGWLNDSNMRHPGHLPVGEGQWETVRQYFTENHNAAIGSDLTIRLDAGAAQAAYDDIRLTKVSGAAIPLVNPSFEMDDVDPNNGWQMGATGWTPNAGPPNAGIFEGASLITPADGAQSAFMETDATLTQTLAGVPLKEGWRYVLLADVADRADTPFASYHLELLAGGEMVAEDLNTHDVLEDQAFFYVTAAVDFTVPGGHALAGQDIGIRLGTTDNAGQDGQVYFDNVRLYAFEVPEPATLALLGLSIAGLAGYIRRRRARA